MNRASAALLLLVGCNAPAPDRSRVDPDPPGPVASGPELHLDVFDAPAVRPVDVLFVVDGSGGFLGSHELGAFGEWFAVQLAASRFDQHIGAISTDMEDPAYRGRLRQAGGVRWVEGDAIDSLLLAAMLQDAADGPGDERGLDAVMAALDVEGDRFNAGFERTDAELHVVVLSFGDDDSVLTTSDAFADWLVARRPDPALVSFSAIVPVTAAECVGFVGDGQTYIEVADRVGGLVWDLCAASLPSAPLVEVVRPGLVDPDAELLLSGVPEPATMQVRSVVGESTTLLVADQDYVWDPVHNAIRFTDWVPTPGAVIEVAYRVASP